VNLLHRNALDTWDSFWYLKSEPTLLLRLVAMSSACVRRHRNRCLLLALPVSAHAIDDKDLNR
ncbi:hypothetical protein Tco_0637339, partial [Tanacetum coccineum]